MGEINVNYSLTYLAYFTPIILTALVVVLIIALRWFTHKERMGRIAQGQSEEPQKGKSHKTVLALGLVIGLIGLALTIGLVTLGIGPWLLAGLLPLFVGLAFILVSFILAPEKPKKEKKEKVEPSKGFEHRTAAEENKEPIISSFEIEDEEDEEQEVM